MKCPWCETEHEMSWGQYWRAPWGKHSCPHCHQKFCVHRGFRYYCIRIAAICFGGVPLAVVSILLGYNPVWGWLCGGLLAGIPIDKCLDNRTVKDKADEPITGANAG